MQKIHIKIQMMQKAKNVSFADGIEKDVNYCDYLMSLLTQHSLMVLSTSYTSYRARELGSQEGAHPGAYCHTLLYD